MSKLSELVQDGFLLEESMAIKMSDLDDLMKTVINILGNKSEHPPRTECKMAALKVIYRLITNYKTNLETGCDLDNKTSTIYVEKHLVRANEAIMKMYHLEKGFNEIDKQFSVMDGALNELALLYLRASLDFPLHWNGRFETEAMKIVAIAVHSNLYTMSANPMDFYRENVLVAKSPSLQITENILEHLCECSPAFEPLIWHWSIRTIKENITKMQEASDEKSTRYYRNLTGGAIRLLAVISDQLLKTVEGQKKIEKFLLDFHKLLSEVEAIRDLALPYFYLIVCLAKKQCSNDLLGKFAKYLMELLNSDQTSRVMHEGASLCLRRLLETKDASDLEGQRSSLESLTERLTTLSIRTNIGDETEEIDKLHSTIVKILYKC